LSHEHLPFLIATPSANQMLEISVVMLVVKQIVVKQNGVN